VWKRSRPTLNVLVSICYLESVTTGNMKHVAVLQVSTLIYRLGNVLSE
jgi:hypothetical protein